METDVKLTKLSRCGGCAAKVGAGTLAALLGGLDRELPERDENLLVGYDKSDDASVYRVTDDCVIIQTVDFFPPVADDAYTYGRVAAANALSDIYAMGGKPKLCQNVMCVPRDMKAETVREILRGGFDAAAEAGAIITGGHSIIDEVPKYGMCVTGFAREADILTNAGARPGDALFLTKALGTGAILTSNLAGLAQSESLDAALSSMQTLNKAAAEAMQGLEIHACTDVTGFGLIGHALELAQASGVTLKLRAGAVNFMPGAVEYAKMGLLPEGLYHNREFAQPHVKNNGVALCIEDLLFDPQTSGGLLIACAGTDADELARRLKKAAPHARLIGEAVKRESVAIIIEA